MKDYQKKKFQEDGIFKLDSKANSFELSIPVPAYERSGKDNSNEFAIPSKPKKNSFGSVQRDWTLLIFSVDPLKTKEKLVEWITDSKREVKTPKQIITGDGKATISENENAISNEKQKSPPKRTNGNGDRDRETDRIRDRARERQREGERERTANQDSEKNLRFKITRVETELRIW